MKSPYKRTESGQKLPTKLIAKSVFGEEDAKLLRRCKIRTPSSEVFRLEYGVDGTSRALYVKLPKNSENSKQRERKIQQLQREYSLADNIKSAFEGDVELQTVIPATFIIDINGLVTYEVCGVSLQDKISSRLRFCYDHGTPDLTRLSELAGRWLQRFHSLELVEDKIDLRHDILAYCGNRLDILSQNKKSQVSNDLAISLTRKISLWIDDALSAPHAKIILCHNDFSPHNIIVTDKGICVLDFAYSTAGLPAFDVACFWHKLEDMKGSPIRGNGGLETIQNDFLHAYGFEFDTRRPDVKLGLARLILSKMLTIMDSGGLGRYSWTRDRHRYTNYLSLLEADFELT
jgi:hypothetical protein